MEKDSAYRIKTTNISTISNQKKNLIEIKKLVPRKRQAFLYSCSKRTFSYRNKVND